MENTHDFFKTHKINYYAQHLCWLSCRTLPSSEGANANLQLRDGKGKTALMIAAGLKKREVIIKDLLAHKADPNQSEFGGNTALTYTSAAGQLENVKILLDAGANPNGNPKSDFKTALSLAKKFKRKNAIKILETAEKYAQS